MVSGGLEVGNCGARGLHGYLPREVNRHKLSGWTVSSEIAMEADEQCFFLGEKALTIEAQSSLESIHVSMNLERLKEKSRRGFFSQGHPGFS